MTNMFKDLKKIVINIFNNLSAQELYILLKNEKEYIDIDTKIKYVKIEKEYNNERFLISIETIDLLKYFTAGKKAKNILISSADYHNTNIINTLNVVYYKN